jgi:ribosome-binding factor A
MASPAPRPPSQRQLRVGELIRHALADLLSRRAIHDEVLERTIVTIPEVRMSPDLTVATVYVEPLGGGEEAARAAVAALARNAKWIRGKIAKAVNLRVAPNLRFLHDTRFDEAAKIATVFQRPEVARDLAADDDSERDQNN